MALGSKVTAVRASGPVTNAKTNGNGKKEKQTVVRAGVQSLAIELGNKIGDQTFADLEETIQSVEFKKISGILIAHDIAKDFTPDEIASIPVIDSVNVDAHGRKVRDGDKYKPIKGNAMPDWTQVQDGKRMKWVSFIHTMLGHSKWVKDLELEIKAHEDAENNKQGADVKLVRMGKPTRQAALKKLRGRRSIIQNTYRTGVQVVQQKALLAQVFPGEVTFQYYQTDKGEIIPSPNPIILWMTKMPKFQDDFSVTSFVHLDFEKAKAEREGEGAEATWNAILASLSRDDEDEDQETDPFLIENREDFFSSAAAMLHWMRNEENIRGMYNQIDKAKDVRDVAHLIKTVCTLATEYKDVYDHFQKKFVKVSAMEDVDAGSSIDKATLKEAIAS